MYQTLIVGAGNQGALADIPGSCNEQKVISFAHAVKEHPGFELVGFVDEDGVKANQAKQIWNAEYASNRVSPAFIRPDVDVMIISTPDDCHYEPLKEALKYKPKLVLCEKPLCTDLEQAKEIVQLYKEAGVPLAVNYTRRYLDYHRDLKKRYEEGQYGSLMWANLVFNRGMLHTGSHAVDFITWLEPSVSEDDGPTCSCRELDVDYRVWQFDLYFEKFHWREERIGDMPVWKYYDYAAAEVLDNVFCFLEGKQPLYCTGEDALKTLKICYDLMGAK